jgi:hypothetical protein
VTGSSLGSSVKMEDQRVVGLDSNAVHTNEIKGRCNEVFLSPFQTMNQESIELTMVISDLLLKRQCRMFGVSKRQDIPSSQRVICM